MVLDRVDQQNLHIAQIGIRSFKDADPMEFADDLLKFGEWRNGDIRAQGAMKFDISIGHRR